MLLDNRVTFNSLSEAWETLLRIAVTNNWQDVVNAHLFTKPARQNATSTRRTAIGLFLVSFYVLVVWFGTNVLAALVIEAIIALNDDKSNPVKHVWKSTKLNTDPSLTDTHPGSNPPGASNTYQPPPTPSLLQRASSSVESRQLDALFARRRLDHQPSFHTVDDEDNGNDGPQLSASAVDALQRKLQRTRQRLAECDVLQTAVQHIDGDNENLSQRHSTTDDATRRWSRLRNFIHVANAFRSQSLDVTRQRATSASSTAPCDLPVPDDDNESVASSICDQDSMVFQTPAA